MALTAVLPLLLAVASAAGSLEDGLFLMKQERYAQAVPALERAAQSQPGSSDVLMNLGWAYLHVHRADDAYRCWSMLVKLEPDNPTFLRLLAGLEVERKNYRQAAVLAGKAHKLAPDDGEVSVVLARALAGEGNHQEASAILENLIRTRPQSASVRFGMADLLAQFDRPQDSLAYLDDLIAADPANASYHKRRAQVLEGLGRAAEAMREWERLAGQRPPDPDAMFELGWLYLGRGRVEDAGKLAALLTQIDPGNGNFLRLSANVELERRDYAKAEELSRWGLKLDPSDKDCALTLAKALNGQGRQKEAMEILEGLVRAHPDNPGARYEMADVLVQMGRAQDSLATMDDLLRADPENVAYHKRRALILRDLGRMGEAEAEWKALAERKPPDQQALLNLGWIYLQEKKIEDAAVIGTRLVELDPSNPVNLRFRASVDIEKLEYGEAIRLAREAVRLGPDDPDNSVILARALIDGRKETEGTAILQNLIKSHHESVSVWLQMAGFLSQTGRPEESLPYYDKVVQSDPTKVNWRRARADALYQAGHYAEAISEYKAMAHATPPDLLSLHRLVDDAFNRSAWREMFDRMKELAAVEPLNIVSWVRIENAYAKLGDIPKAVAAADKVTALNPASLDGVFMKAELLEEKQDWEGAKKAYELCLSRNPRSRRAMDGLARIPAEHGDYREAMRMQDRIQATYPSEKAYPYLAIRKAAWLAESGHPEAALPILERFTRTRPVVIPAFLYHGISAVERSDSVSVKLFRSQMKVLKRAGYHSITVSELMPYLNEGKPLPPKPILITFDDGRTDSFRNADPVLAEVGFKATMFVIGAGLTRYPYHAGAEAIRRYRASGRWELQAHSDKSHEPLPVDAQGDKLCPLANRLWLPEAGRLETDDEYKARIEGDYISIKNILKEGFPDDPLMAFAFPMGEYGQIDSNNVPAAAAINRAMVMKHYSLAFIQDIHGFNTKDSLRSEWARWEIFKDVSPRQMLAHLAMDEPWVQAKILEARLWVWEGQPGRAYKIVRELEREGIQGPDLFAAKGAALERLGQAYQAQELYAMARTIDPVNPGYQKLFNDAQRNYGPTVNTNVDSYSDNAFVRNTKALVTLGAPVRQAQLLGSFGRASYLQRGAPRFDGTQAGLELRMFPAVGANVELAYARRQLSGDGVRTFDDYGAQGSLQMTPDLKAGLQLQGDNVEYAAAIAAGIREQIRGATLEWARSLDTTLALSGDLVGYSDGNSVRDARLELTRRLTDLLSVGYSFWYGDSARLEPEYWTPRNLRQHMALFSLAKESGDFRGRLEYGAGYGYEALSSHFVQSIHASAEWRTSDYLSLVLGGSYSQSPLYLSREVNAGLTLRY